METAALTPFVLVLLYAAQLAIILRVLLRTGILPTVRLGWVMVIGLVPLLGIALYLFFGEIRLARNKAQRISVVRARFAGLMSHGPADTASPDGMALPVFATGAATSGFPPVPGNVARMLPEGDAQFDDLIAEIAAATDTVHIVFYIWLPDTVGTRLANAVCDAARRGVAARILVDDLGSRPLIRSPLWAQMEQAGVQLARAFPLGNPAVSVLFQRLDLRNHRKIAVVDNRVTWCGSRNAADAAFLPKARFGPWVDILMRIEGPLVRQMQAVFLQDWLLYADGDDHLSDLVAGAHPPIPGGFTGQVIATGPDQSATGLSDTMCALLYGARDHVNVTTPYYVPDQQTQAALCAAALRGVKVTMILPARNDNWIVGAASESHYDELLLCGVRIHAFTPGLLHSKIMTVDGRLALIGSTNMDRRSFNLNYENSMLIDSVDVTAELDAVQQGYIDRATEISLSQVQGWGPLRRIRNNSVALAEPLL
jgi:cardiolipin synthase